MNYIIELVGPAMYVRSHIYCSGFEECSRLVGFVVNLSYP